MTDEINVTPDDAILADVLSDFKESHPDGIFSLEMTRVGGCVTTRGALASVAAHTHLLDLLNACPEIDSVDDHLEITAPFSTGYDIFADLDEQLFG